MRPLIVFSDVTLDGFMAGPDNDLDFVASDPQLGEEFTTELRAVADTIIFGGLSFPVAGAYWTKADGVLADWMNATPKIALSTRAGFDVSSWPNSTQATGLDPIRRLKESDGAAIVAFGGARAVRSLVAADLVDEFWLKINPTAVGRGGSVFGDLPAPRTLVLRSARTYPSGTIAAVYER